MASYAIENTFNLIQIGYKAAVVCLFCCLLHEPQPYSKPYKALGNYPETAILLFVTFTKTTVHLHGDTAN